MEVDFLDFLISALEPESNELPAVFMQERSIHPDPYKSDMNDRLDETVSGPEKLLEAAD